MKKIAFLLLAMMIYCHQIVVESLATGEGYPDVNNRPVITYTREELLQLSNGPYDRPALQYDPDDIKKRTHRRGRRGGIRARCRRRGPKTPLPMIVTGNARSIRNKTDELAALARWNFAYRESALICLTETWLQPGKDPDSAFNLDGFNLIRGDRTEESGKTLGGGVCVYVNNRWCKDITIFEQCCHQDVEYLTLSLRPYYLPRELTKIYLTVTYIPPSADVKEAESKLYSVVSKMQSCNPDAVNIITGDFNNCSFGKCIPTFQQYINFPTRSDKLLDPFYCNIKHSYVAKKMPPLGISDHNMCHLTPIYKQKLKLHKPIEKQVYSWNSDVNETLLGCMECTDFDVLYDDDETIDHNVAVLNGYIQLELY